MRGVTRARCAAATIAIVAALLAAVPGGAGEAAAGTQSAAHAGARPTTSTADGLTVSVGYAEDKESNTPNAASFPTPWAGSPNTTFLGNPVPGMNVCGSLTLCYDAGAIRLDNPGSTAVSVDSVSVDVHSSISGGKKFNLWGSFAVPAGQSVILTANPPSNDPGYDNFDTSGYPSNNCTPITIAPTVTITVGGVGTTLADSTHVLDTGGIDTGYCPPKQNESIQWRLIGAAGTSAASLSLGPATATQFAGQKVTETATVLDGGGAGLPNVGVGFDVVSGPDAGQTGTVVTNAQGRALFTYTGVGEGEDVVAASVTSVGTFQSNQARVMWTDDSATPWSSADVGAAVPAGGQSLATATGTWTVSGGGADIGGTSDQFHFLWQQLAGSGGAAAHVTSQTNTNPAAKAGVMLRAGSSAGAPYYAALVTPGDGILVQERTAQGGTTTTVVNPSGSVPTYLWVSDTGSSVTTYTSPDGYTWQPLAGSTVSLSLGSTLLGGLAVTSHSSTQLSTATMDTVVVSAQPPAPVPPVPCPAPWTCADIGSPAPAGSQSFDPGSATWTINASGADIGGTNDQFRYVSQTLSGDGSVTARVVTQSNTSVTAKAGVMLRATTDPASPEYAALVTPGNGIKVQERSAQGGTTTKLANPSGTVPAYLRVSRAGNTFSAYTSSDGVTWTLVSNSSFTMTMPGSLLAGIAMTSHSSGVLGTVTVDSVAVAAAVSACPAPWTCADIGNPTPAGSQSYSGSTWTIAAGGNDIGGTTDQGRFVWETLNGDGSVSARVATQTNTSVTAKAGVMFRVSTDPACPEYGVFVTPGTGIKVQERTAQGGATTKLTNPAGTVPVYLRVTRSGNTFTAYTSADGVTWTLIPGSTFTMTVPTTLLEGLAVTSHNNASLSTVTLDSVGAS